MNTQVLNVPETLCRAKIQDVRGCADECAFSLYVYMHALIRCVCMCFFSPVYVVRMNKKIKKKLGGVHGIQSVSDLANIVPSVWPVWLNVMLACCVDSNLKKKKKLCRLFPTVRVFFFFLLRKHLHRTNKKKDMWRNP